MRKSRLARHLPVEAGDWRGEEIEVTGRELEVLARDTEFERFRYVNAGDSSLPPLQASVVFSGKDMNTSIHRPEVCLRTQGWFSAGDAAKLA